MWDYIPPDEAKMMMGAWAIGDARDRQRREEEAAKKVAGQPTSKSGVAAKDEPHRTIGEPTAEVVNWRATLRDGIQQDLRRSHEVAGGETLNDLKSAVLRRIDLRCCPRCQSAVKGTLQGTGYVNDGQMGGRRVCPDCSGSGYI